jgi:hypothetical protein
MSEHMLNPLAVFGEPHVQPNTAPDWKLAQPRLTKDATCLLIAESFFDKFRNERAREDTPNSKRTLQSNEPQAVRAARASFSAGLSLAHSHG